MGFIRKNNTVTYIYGDLPAMDGQPFFLVSKVVVSGLLTVFEEEIVPRLEHDVPCQPSLFELEEELRPCFTLVFDREGYNPDFMLKMWKGLPAWPIASSPGGLAGN